MKKEDYLEEEIEEFEDKLDDLDKEHQKLKEALNNYKEELANTSFTNLATTVVANSLPLNDEGKFSTSLAVKETACAGAAVGAAYLLDPVEGTIAVVGAVSAGMLTAYNHVKNDGCESIREFFLRRPVRSVKKLFG